MSAFGLLYLMGTIGFFVLVAYGALYLRLWPLCVATLTVVLLGGLLSIGILRLLIQGNALDLQDARLIAGVAPWMAIAVLVSRRHPQRSEGLDA